MKITWAKNIRLTYSIFQLYSYNKYEKRGIIPANGIVPICSHKRVTVFSLGKTKNGYFLMRLLTILLERLTTITLRLFRS